MSKKITGGYILLARKLLKNELMDKPPLYMKLWIWMLTQANYKDHGNLKRGQFFTSLKEMQEAMSYKIGYRLMKPTIKEIRGVTKVLTKGNMVVTTKVTHGMIITILNYDYYQNIKNYEGHNEGHNEGHLEGTILRKKEIKKEKKNTNSGSKKHDPRVKIFIDWWCSMYEKRFKKKYAVAGAKTGGQVKHLLSMGLSWENLLYAAMLYLLDEDDFIAKSGHDIGMFIIKINKYDYTNEEIREELKGYLIDEKGKKP
jgi:hypothetical protein